MLGGISRYFPSMARLLPRQIALLLATCVAGLACERSEAPEALRAPAVVSPSPERAADPRLVAEQITKNEGVRQRSIFVITPLGQAR